MNNWISGEVNLIGVGVRYERMLAKKLSVGVSAHFSIIPVMFFLYNDIVADATIRFYPLGKTFFVGAGLGFYSMDGSSSWLGWRTGYWSYLGMAITPELGLKIDIGKPGKLFVQPGVKLPLVVVFSGDETEFQIGMPLIYFGFGFAF